MITKIFLNEQAIQYINEEIKDGGALFNQILRVNLNNGSVFSYLPFSQSKAISMDYSESLSYLTGMHFLNEIELLIIKLISDFLNNNPNKYAVFETMARIGDPIINKCGMQAFYVKGRMYDFIRGSDKDKPIKKCLDDAQGYPTIIGLINTYNEDFRIIKDQEFTDIDNLKFMNFLEGLIIGAFDGEGYIIWQSHMQKRSK